MSSEWEDEPRPRRPRYEDIEVRRGSGRGGGVTAAGVFSIVMGALSFLCFFCAGIVGFFLVGIGEIDRQQGAMLPGGVAITGGVLVGLAVLYLIVGVCYLIAGIVTLQRRHWGRMFALIMAGVSVLLGITMGVFTVLGFMGADPLGGGDPEGQAFIACMNLFAGLVYLAHAVVVFATLLNSYNIAEFE
jgi:hypothetical protein